jgi:hypothetical protein
VTRKLRNHFIEKICSFDDEASLDEYPNDEASLDEYPTHRENIFSMVIEKICSFDDDDVMTKLAWTNILTTKLAWTNILLIEKIYFLW